MSNVTLVLSRIPLHEFHYEAHSGRWGNMAVVEGPKILGAGFPNQSLSVAGTAASKVGSIGWQAVNRQRTIAIIPFGGKKLELVTDGGPIQRVTEFDSMERFRSDKGKGFYMQVRPRPTQPYPLTMESSSEVARLNRHGHCLRVHGHGYKQQGSHADAGILVHEAPKVAWLIGCISPREKNHRKQGEESGPSRRAMEFIFHAMGGFKSGVHGALIVLDW
jgi:hypothetical protein